jgi:hypothetical protein
MADPTGGVFVPMPKGYVAMKLWPLAVVALFVWPGAAASAQDPAPLGKEAKICRNSAPKTGSRVKTGPRCKTAEEWRKEDEERSRIPLSATVTEGQPDGPSRPRPQ